jgi:uncharacterized membrane protein YbhN (UPF0104 family)
MLFFLDVRKTISVFESVNPIWLIPIVLVNSFDWIIRGIRWKIILSNFHSKITLLDSVGLVLIGNWLDRGTA